MKNSDREPENSTFFRPEDVFGTSEIICEKELSKEFVNYLQSIFDVLDEEHCGYIKLTDIETYCEVKGPSFSAMIDYLRQVSPANGLINFETLCTGMKFAVQAPNITSIQKNQDWTSDSSEDSFRVQDFETKDQLLKKPHSRLVSEEPRDTWSVVNGTKTTLTS